MNNALSNRPQSTLLSGAGSNDGQIQSNNLSNSQQQLQQSGASQQSNQQQTYNSNSQNPNKLDDALMQSKDAQTIVSVLKDMGIDEYEPRVVNQLLEFSYRYITNLLEDAKAFSSHANKKTIDSEDIKMAIKSKVDYSFTTTPPRDLLMEISKTKNKNPLPPIKYHTGIRLPPDRFCLHAPNYSLKTQMVTQHHQEDENVIYQQNRGIYQQQSNNQSNQNRNQDNMASLMSSASSIAAKRQRTDEEDYDI